MTSRLVHLLGAGYRALSPSFVCSVGAYMQGRLPLTALRSTTSALACKWPCAAVFDTDRALYTARTISARLFH